MHVAVEKGSLAAAAMLLISAGVERALHSQLGAGCVLIALGLVLLFTREYFKLHRWAHLSQWRGKRV